MTESFAQTSAASPDLREVVRLHHCPDCNYDLAALPRRHTCPECGFAYDETMFDVFIGPGAFRHGSRWIPFVGVLWLVLLLCAGVGGVMVIVTCSIVLGIWIICEIGLQRGRSSGRYRLVVIGDDLRTVADAKINRAFRTREFGSVAARRKLLGGYRLKLCGARWADPGGPLDPILRCDIDAAPHEVDAIVNAISQRVEEARERVRNRARNSRDTMQRRA